MDSQNFARQDIEAIAYKREVTNDERSRSALIADAADGDPGEAGEQAVLAASIEREDDFWINRMTGEIVALVEQPPRFEVDSESAAKWVLQKLMSEEASLMAVRLQQAAINKNLDTEARSHEQRIAYFHRRFDASLREFAERALEGKKTRTWRCAWGTVSFRKTSGTNKIIDLKAAVDWARRHVPTAIKTTESVSVTDLLPHLEEFAPEDRPAWLQSTPGGDSMTISTGLEKK